MEAEAEEEEEAEEAGVEKTWEETESSAWASSAEANAKTPPPLLPRAPTL